jgi:UDP-glucose 4-epimerase
MSRLCLVLGGSGFIGSHLVRQLTARGMAVRVLGRDRSRFYRNVGLTAGVEFYEGEVSDPGAIAHALQDATDVVHLVHTTVPATSMIDMHRDLHSNVAPLISLLTFIRDRSDVNRFVYISSGGTVYGNSAVRRPMAESLPLAPISSYGLTKLVSEHYVRLCLMNSHVEPYILRPANVYGERQSASKNQGAVGVFLRALASGMPITLYGDGSVIRDYVYVADVVDAVELCLDGPQTQPSENEVPTFNVGTGVGTSLAELITAIEQATGRALTVHSALHRTFDCAYNVLDTSLIQRALGWYPSVALAEGLQRTWQWIVESGQSPVERVLTEATPVPQLAQYR